MLIAGRLSGVCVEWYCFFLFQAEDGIRDLVRSRGLGDVYKRQVLHALLVVQSSGNGFQLEGDFGKAGFPCRAAQGLSLIHI